MRNNIKTIDIKLIHNRQLYAHEGKHVLCKFLFYLKITYLTLRYYSKIKTAIIGPFKSKFLKVENVREKNLFNEYLKIP